MCITAECPDPTETGIWWRDDASWKLYSKESMIAISKAMLKGTTSLHLPLLQSSAHPQGASYLIDLSKMEQTNTHSGHKRAIKLILPSSFSSSKTAQRVQERAPAAPVQNFSAAWFRMGGSSKCLLVIRPGNIVEWKVDGLVDAVVNPCSTMGGSLRIVSKEESSLESTLFSGGEAVVIPSDFAEGAMLDVESGRSFKSLKTSFCNKVDVPKQAHSSAVAKALHQAAGPKLQEALQKSVHFASGQGRCGDAVITPGFQLPASRVVHAFAPPRYRKHDEAASISKLKKTYTSALSLAAVNGIRYIAFPAVSCGAGGFPLPLAARAALDAVSGFNNNAMLEIHFVLPDQSALLEWVAQASQSFSRA